MPVKIAGGRLLVVAITLLVMTIAGLLTTVGLIDGAFAQTSPSTKIKEKSGGLVPYAKVPGDLTDDYSENRRFN
jgi:hypothetical protein